MLIPPNYRRPEIIEPRIVDEHGVPIRFGERWEDMPPDDAYLDFRHQKRFAELQTVAIALINFLHRTYDTEIDDPTGMLQVHDGRDHPLLGTVRVVPQSQAASPLVFSFEEDYMVSLKAGHFFEERFPSCGCAACDETVIGAAEDLEETVFAVTSGHLRESVSRWPHTWLGSSFVHDGREYSSSMTRLDRDQKQKLKKQLQIRLRGGNWEWAAW